MSKYASMMVAAGFALAAVPALAQTTPSQPGQLPSGKAPANTTASPTATTPAPVAVTQPVRASSIMKGTVQNAAGEKVADVSDLVVDASGSVKSIILGVGGFLGIGERNVAVDLSSLKMMHDSSGRIILVSEQMKSKDEVKNMPEWKDPNTAAGASTMPTGSTAPSTGATSTTGTPTPPKQ